MTPEQRDAILRILKGGEELAPEWARILFPPERREYELVYHGKQREADILAETLAVPLQPIRTFASNGSSGDWQNMLAFGDNLQVMKKLLDWKEQGRLVNPDGTRGIKLVYIDPPFATKHDFRGSLDQKAYADRLAGATFLEFLRKRLVLIKELLAPDGVVFVHTDWKKGHYIKLLLDEILGESRFRNEIVWWYYNKMQGNINRFPSNHETIFFYSAGSTFAFHPAQEEREEGHKSFLKRVWDSKTKRLKNARDSKGKLLYIETDEKRVDDVWRLSMLQPADKTENLGYPTQKPETLLALILASASNEGDLVMDAFAGSGTTLAVAEKLGRRWVGIDCGKLAIYTIQKRLLSLRKDISNTGAPLAPKPFTLYNAGLYDYTALRQLPWESWRFFALSLFQCHDEPHTIGGVKLDGFLKGSSVLVFNHTLDRDALVDETTVASLHESLGSRIGSRLFIIAPALTFGFQEDYLVLDDVRYFALRIPYSLINEIHQRSFTALKQPSDERDVNDTVDAVGFDFVRPPDVEFRLGVLAPKEGKGEVFFLQVTKFRSDAAVRDPGAEKQNRDALSCVMLDMDYDEETKVFDLDRVVFGDQLATADWRIEAPLAEMGPKAMAVFIDIYGNEARRVVNRPARAASTSSAAKAPPKKQARRPAGRVRR